MMPGDVSLHLLQDHPPHDLLQRRVDPATTSLLYSMMEYPPYPSNERGHQPGLCAKEKDGLHYGRI